MGLGWLLLVRTQAAILRSQRRATFRSLHGGCIYFAAANQRRPCQATWRATRARTAISLFLKNLLPSQSPLPCFACQMFLQNVSSRLAFVHKVILVGKKSLSTWALCILYVKWISLLGQRPRVQHTRWVRRELLCWETGGPTHSNFLASDQTS